MGTATPGDTRPGRLSSWFLNVITVALFIVGLVAAIDLFYGTNMVPAMVTEGAGRHLLVSVSLLMGTLGIAAILDSR